MKMNRNAFALVVVLAPILLAGCLTSPPAPPQVSNVNPVDVGNWWGDWIRICIFALFLSMLVVALAYMYGSVVRSPETLAWCKVEIYQIAMTGLMVAGLIGFVYTVAAIDTSFMGIGCTLPAAIGESATISLGSTGAGCNMFDLSMVYLKWMRQQTWITYQRVWLIYQKYASQTAISDGAALGGIGPQLQPMAWLQPVLSYTTLILNFIVPALVTIMALIEIMRYIQFGMLNIILPVGVVCRCFGPLRNFGGTLMGMAIALFVFFPFMFALNAAIIMPSQVDPVTGLPTPYAMLYKQQEIVFETRLTDVSTTIDELDYLKLDNLVKAGILTNLGDPSSPSLTPWQTMTRWADGTWYQTSVMLDGIAVGQLNFNTSHIIFGALVLPILDFMIIVVAARDLSRMLGEEIDVSNLTRII